MNRHDRRVLDKKYPREQNQVNVSRPDGRPEAYEVPLNGGKLHCVACLVEDKQKDQRYGQGEIFMCSPIDVSDGQAHMICLAHLPENIVIFDPKTNTCRDKTGQNVWTEGDANAV